LETERPAPAPGWRQADRRARFAVASPTEPRRLERREDRRHTEVASPRVPDRRRQKINAADDNGQNGRGRDGSRRSGQIPRHSPPGRDERNKPPGDHHPTRAQDWKPATGQQRKGPAGHTASEGGGCQQSQRSGVIRPADRSKNPVSKRAQQGEGHQGDARRQRPRRQGDCQQPRQQPQQDSCPDWHVVRFHLINRETGLAVTSVAFDSRAALEGTREQARGLRTRGSAEARLEILEVAEFELALAHLDVPELV